MSSATPGKYVLLTSLDENDELNVWKFYNVIRTVEETFHTLKTDLDIRPVYHKTDGGIKAHLNLAVLAYWIVSVAKYRLKLKVYPNIRWDEIMRIAQTQVVVTAEMDTKDGGRVSIRQSTVDFTFPMGLGLMSSSAVDFGQFLLCLGVPNTASKKSAF